MSGAQGCPVQVQIRDWYLQAFAQVEAGTTGAIALADEADGEEATPDKAADASSDWQRMQQKVGQDVQLASLHVQLSATQRCCERTLCDPHQE